jgi:putative transposase
LYCHLIWTTKDREPWLVGEDATIAERGIRAVCRELGAVVLALGIVPDHVHLAVSLPTRLSVAELMKQVKGNSSHLLNMGPDGRRLDRRHWQREYGALSFGARSLDQIVGYVRNQEAHHASGDLLPNFERLESLPHDHTIESDPPMSSQS